MAKTKIAPPSGGTKGAPPQSAAAPKNLERPDHGGETVSLTFTVPKEYRQELKLYAAEQGKTMVDILFEAVELHRQQ